MPRLQPVARAQLRCLREVATHGVVRHDHTRIKVSRSVSEFRFEMRVRIAGSHSGQDLSAPATADLVRRWVADGTLADLAVRSASVEEMLAAVWDDVSEAARGRDSRRP